MLLFKKLHCEIRRVTTRCCGKGGMREARLLLSVGTETMSAKEKHHKGGEKLKTQKR